MRIALVAGELSGDLLGAGLIAALKERYPHAQFVGIGGPAMISQGMESWTPLERLAVMGLVEVLRHLPELFRIRRQLVERLLADPPAVFIGIDAPDFNLGLERRLRVQGIPTVHYVSPSVWAWRPWRVRKIARAVNLMLTLFPFEAAFYQQRGVPVRYVGHPLADEIPLHSDGREAQRVLGLSLPVGTRIVALLPGSRMGEVSRIGPLFLEAAGWLFAQRPALRFLMPAATPQIHEFLAALHSTQAPDLPLTLTQGHSREVMAVAEVVLLASGTATLEAMLLKRPMVVAYRVAPVTAWIARRLVTIRHFSLPNLLAGRELVPEFFQEAATRMNLGAAVLHGLDDTAAGAALAAEFVSLHIQLRRSASQQAATAIAELLEAGQLASLTD
jgi:lipid-A-disaccharide synthase